MIIVHISLRIFIDKHLHLYSRRKFSLLHDFANFLCRKIDQPVLDLVHPSITEMIVANRHNLICIFLIYIGVGFLHDGEPLCVI